MLRPLPATAAEFADWAWPEIEPHYKALGERELSEETCEDWLADWTRLSFLVWEVGVRLHVATTQDTTDAEVEKRRDEYTETVEEPSRAADQELTLKFIDSGLVPEGMAIPLQIMRQTAEIFREENLPLDTEAMKLGSEYNRIIGAQAVEWDGEERTISQLRPLYQEQDRSLRERAWRLGAERQLADREAIDEVWIKLLDVRRKMAANADCGDFRSFRWKDLCRFDYTPEDCRVFHRAIEQVIVPAAARACDRRRQRLGVDSLRPWDMDVDPLSRPALQPFTQVDRLEARCAAILHRVDPQLGEHFEIMRREGLLDLDNRKGKAPGGYCTTFPAAKRPFIFMNAVGLHRDVQTLLHEAGHCFHDFESVHLPYSQQLTVPMEFAEVGSMAMELLASPYLEEAEGGFYSAEDAARARTEHLEQTLLFWPYMAVVDAFQHWVYENPDEGRLPVSCDKVWAELYARFCPYIDYSGLEDIAATGWQRKQHIIRSPFYYVEYGLASLGALQVWQRAQEDQSAAVAAYRHSLSLGATRSLPDLFSAAGARFAFDAETLSGVVNTIETALAELDPTGDQALGGRQKR